jgi:putative Mg2+ transporter-C (MgtC) family protein
VFGELSNLIAMAAAYALALPIGWERERGDRSAGIRTFPLVAIASCGFVLATAPVLEGHPEGRARIIEGVITGMGFIGGGAILKTGDNVRGTATAASLWATGAIGVAVAVEAFQVAIALSVMTLLTLRILAPFRANQSED